MGLKTKCLQIVWLLLQAAKLLCHLDFIVMLLAKTAHALFYFSYQHVKSSSTIYNDCPGCILISRTFENTPTALIRQSAIQYLQHTMTDKSRYIVTMRNPTDRMISHYFYLHKQNVVSVFDFYQNLLTYPRKKLQKSFNIQEWILSHQRYFWLVYWKVGFRLACFSVCKVATQDIIVIMLSTKKQGCFSNNATELIFEIECIC